jgi:YVTN family beta-propeller protein
MTIDLTRQSLFVAELGNDSVGIVDLANRKVINRIPGLKEPQGVGYEPSTDTLYIANAGDGSVNFFDGDNYKSAENSNSAAMRTNIRVDAAAKRVFVGYGSGGLAVIDPSTRSKVGDISLKAHRAT